jgi:hypothetical protein
MSVPSLRSPLTPLRLVAAFSAAVVAITLAADFSPSLVQAAGATAPADSGSATTPVPAYWIDTSYGAVDAFGGAGFYGSAANLKLNKPIVGMAPTHDGAGYWLDASDGGIFSYGDATFYGSAGSIRLNKPVVGMAPTHDGRGYWLVASDGGIFSYGDATFYGSTGNMKLNAPVVGMAPTPDGRGYWLVASDGGIFCFGDAQFAGSTGDLKLNKPIVGMAPTPNGLGYWLVASDGGVFAFGDAGFEGSMGGVTLASPVASIAATPDGNGYWFASDNGTVYAFGDANYFGSATRVSNVVGITEGPGSGYAPHDTSYPSGAYGNDVSNWQCGEQNMPTGHTIGIVEVEGWSFGAVNPCLRSEATWAGSGLELYLFLAYGTQTSGPSQCEGNAACNYGYAAAQHAYSLAKAAEVDANVIWWLDVETSSNNWSSDHSANASVIKGALLGLQTEGGVPDVGIYSNRSEWSSVVGGSTYSPYVPEWVSDWGDNEPPFDPSMYCNGYNFASGPTWLIQYTDGAHTNGLDGDYSC